MNEFIDYLGEKKAKYYYDLYKSNKPTERREECEKRIKTIDEYILLLDIIERLPFETKQAVERVYETELEILTL